MEGIRYAHIGLACGTSILIVGAILLHDNPPALQAVAIVALIVTFGVFHGLDERARRRQKDDQ